MGMPSLRQLSTIEKREHLHIKAFYGTSERCNKKPNLDRRLGLPADRHRQIRLDLHGSLYTLLQVISVTLFEKMPISQALQQKDYTSPQLTDSNQWILFNF